MLCDKTFGKTVTYEILKGRLHAREPIAQAVCSLFPVIFRKAWEKDEVRVELANQQEEMAGNSLYREGLSVCGLSTQKADPGKFGEWEVVRKSGSEEPVLAGDKITDKTLLQVPSISILC